MNTYPNELTALRPDKVTEGSITATVIQCPGRWEDSFFEAVQIEIEGVHTPFVMTMALPKVFYRALSPFVRPAHLYAAIADAINRAQSTVKVEYGEE